MKTRSILSIVLYFTLVSCASMRHPSYYTASFQSRVNGVYEIRVESTRAYCPSTKNDKDGKPIYPLSCGTVDKPVFQIPAKDKDPKTNKKTVSPIFKSTRRIVEKMCGGAAYLIHSKFNKDYIGQSPSTCYDNSYGSTRASFSCYGGYPIYHYHQSLFYQCFTQKDCDNGNTRACAQLGYMELERKNTTKAKPLLKIACDKEDTLACTGLAYLEEIQGNRSEAKKIWEKLCKKGASEACNILQKRYSNELKV